MKKFAAILLILILLFNWYGYRIVTAVLSHNADKNLEVQLDNLEYEESQLLTIRIPLNIPYVNDQAEFERHYGEIVIDRQYYTYVKRKIENGFLILKCIPNSVKEQIESAGSNYFKMTNGLDDNQPGKKQNGVNFLKNLLVECDDRNTDNQVELIAVNVSKRFNSYDSSLSTIFQAVPGKPPQTYSLS